MDQQVTLLECNLDDMTGEALGYALEQLLSAGALDAWFTPIYMKKNRPGVILSILCLPDEAQAFCGLLLRETQTLGVRWHVLHRQVAERRMATVSTAWGDVRCKLKVLDGRVVDAKPEYEDCAALARRHVRPLQEMVRAAQRAAETLLER
jgi:uncharacterized protein (DUF111 family)